MDPEQTIRPGASHPYLPPSDPRVASLKVISGSLSGREYRLTNERYSIGRDPESDIIIDQQEVSRRHADVIRMASEYVVTDCGSANGVFVNNLRLDRAVLAHGDVFQIGSCVFQFIWNRQDTAA